MNIQMFCKIALSLTLVSSLAAADAIKFQTPDGGEEMAELHDFSTFLNFLPGMDKDVLKSVLDGKSSLRETVCDCYVQKQNSDSVQKLTAVDVEGLNDTDAFDNAIRSCMQVAKTSTNDNAARVAVASCKFSNGHNVAQIKAQLQKVYDQMKAADDKMAADQASARRWWPGNYIPNFIKVAISGLAGGILWSTRGGNPYFLPNVVGGTQGARFTFGFLGYAVVNCLINATDWDMCKDATIGDALGALPLFFFGWDQNAGYAIGGDNQWHASLALNDDSDMLWRGLLQMAFEIPYMKSQGYNTDPLILGGMGMGPCYAASGIATAGNNPAGSFNSNLLTTVHLDGFTQMGEFCFGVSKGVSESLMMIHGKTNPASPLDQNLNEPLDFWQEVTKIQTPLAPATAPVSAPAKAP
jgi:hypothetical protein